MRSPLGIDRPGLHGAGSAARDRTGHTVLDLDYRAALWPDLADGPCRGAGSDRPVDRRGRQPRGVPRWRSARTTPDAAADALLAAGVELAIVKLGADGSLLATADGRWRVAPVPVTVVCGLGAGDAFGGALSHGLLSGWDVPRIGTFANAAGAFVSAQLTCADAMPIGRATSRGWCRHEREPEPRESTRRSSRPGCSSPTASARRSWAVLAATVAGDDGRLLILAADHTARGMLAASGDPLAVADRYTLLDRLVRSPGRARCRRRARQCRHPRGARVARGARWPARDRHDEPRRHHRRRLGARRPHDRLRRRPRRVAAGSTAARCSCASTTPTRGWPARSSPSPRSSRSWPTAA